MEIKYDVPFEVTEEQYNLLMTKCEGVVAGRYDEKSGKYYIKVWFMKYVEEVKKIAGL